MRPWVETFVYCVIRGQWSRRGIQEAGQISRDRQVTFYSCENRTGAGRKRPSRRTHALQRWRYFLPRGMAIWSGSLVATSVASCIFSFRRFKRRDYDRFLCGPGFSIPFVFYVGPVTRNSLWGRFHWLDGQRLRRIRILYEFYMERP